MQRATKAWPIVVSVALLLLAFPPINLGFLVLVGLTPWLLSLRESSPWGAFRSGYLFGFLFMAGQFHWLVQLVERWVGNAALGFIPLLVGSLLGGFYFAAAGCLIRLAWVRQQPWMIPLLWAGIEVIRANIPGLAFPWGLLATPLYPYPIMLQTAWFGTIFLVSAWAVLPSLTIALWITGKPFPTLRPYVYAFLILFALSSFRLSVPIDGTATRITAGQLGEDMAFGDPKTEPERLRVAVAELTAGAALQGSRLLVLPEGLTQPSDTLPPPKPFDVRPDVPVLFGGQRGTDPTFQSAFSFDGTTWRYADKLRLVIFGEYVPFRDQLPFLQAFELPSGDLTAADRVSAVQVGSLRVGPMLCFEALFHDVASAQARNGAQLLATMAIDDWYMGSGAPEQLKAGSVFRAIETGLPLVRSAPLGYTMAVDARGRIVRQAPLGKRVPLGVELAIPERPDRFPGVDAVPILLALSVLLPILWPRRSEPGSPGTAAPKAPEKPHR